MQDAPPKRRPERAAGILLHPTSLPGPFGIGDLGPAAYAWVDWLAAAKQTWWQILPLGPTAYGDSPYQCLSAFAGNPYLVSPDALVRDGLLEPGDGAGATFPAERVDYGAVIPFKLRLLRRAWESYRAARAPALRPAFEEFADAQAHWLDDFALFMALKQAHGGAGRSAWPADLVRRRPAAVAEARSKLADAVDERRFHQFLFFRQWSELRRYANGRGVRVIGDVPIFVSDDSADAWAHPELFGLDEAGRPTVVAGVPPDYFSPTGQLWGNPLYRWDVLKQTDYAWWVARLRATLEQVDLARLDHFRGFEASWAVPAGDATAEGGEWVAGPGADLFRAAVAALGGLPFIAEDLGLITPEVEALRKRLGLPGMRVLQFAFSGPDNPYLPHQYERRTVAYTGTHDNDTARGWYSSLPAKEKQFLERYLGRPPGDIAAELVRLAWASVADYAVAPLQDVLGLGPETRMNQPGRPAGNWGWRFTPAMLSESTREALADLTELYDRAPESAGAAR
jgi:4-alpha-glucanotransferase